VLETPWNIRLNKEQFPTNNKQETRSRSTEKNKKKKKAKMDASIEEISPGHHKEKEK
jgi:hypothetical protein